MEAHDKPITRAELEEVLESHYNQFFTRLGTWSTEYLGARRVRVEYDDDDRVYHESRGLLLEWRKAFNEDLERIIGISPYDQDIDEDETLINNLDNSLTHLVDRLATKITTTIFNTATGVCVFALVWYYLLLR